jgi:hypothetical protein
LCVRGGWGMETMDDSKTHSVD